MSIHTIKQLFFALAITITAHAYSKADVFSHSIEDFICRIGDKFFKADNDRYNQPFRRRVPIQKIEAVRYRGPKSKNQYDVDAIAESIRNLEQYARKNKTLDLNTIGKMVTEIDSRFGQLHKRKRQNPQVQRLEKHCKSLIEEFLLL